MPDHRLLHRVDEAGRHALQPDRAVDEERDREAVLQLGDEADVRWDVASAERVDPSSAAVETATTGVPRTSIEAEDPLGRARHAADPVRGRSARQSSGWGPRSARRRSRACSRGSHSCCGPSARTTGRAVRAEHRPLGSGQLQLLAGRRADRDRARNAAPPGARTPPCRAGGARAPAPPSDARRSSSTWIIAAHVQHVRSAERAAAVGDHHQDAAGGRRPAPSS